MAASPPGSARPSRRLRRLGRLASAVAAGSAQPLGSVLAQRTPIGRASAALLPLPLDADGGGVAAAQLLAVRERRRAAVEAENFRLAAELTDLLRVIEPPGGTARGVTTEDFAPPTLEEQEACFLWNGFVVLRGVFAGEHLARLQAAWRRRQRPIRAEWAGRVAAEWGAGAMRNAEQQRAEAGNRPSPVNPNFVDIPTPELFAGLREQVAAGGGTGCEDAVLLDLVDPPRLTALLRRLLVHDEETALRMFAIQSRTYPPSSHTESELGVRGYIGWHRDFDGPGIGVSAVNPSAVIKCFTYFEDCGHNDGQTTLVPGSNALTFDCRHAFRMQRRGRDVHELAESADAYYHVLPQGAMPGYVQLDVKAGDVALFDTTCWHTASANLGSRDRQNTIIHYHGQELAPTNLNDAIPRNYLESFAAAGLLASAERRQIFGMDVQDALLDADL